MKKCLLCKNDVKYHNMKDYADFCEPCARDIVKRKTPQKLVLDYDCGELNKPQDCEACGS